MSTTNSKGNSKAKSKGNSKGNSGANSHAATNSDAALFWDVAQPLLAAGHAVEGELMRSRCIRVGKEFLAMPEYRTGDLVVKLPAARVAELIDEGEGLAFAPAKKVFKEWVQVPRRDEALWTGLLAEGLEFVS